VASEKYLALVGVGEEDTAHLRLLLRMVAKQLAHRWRWGTEEQADLIIVDPEQLAGQIGRNRAFSGGRRCAVFSESEPLREGELRLHRPPRADNFADVLNGTAATALGADAQVTQFKNDFYDIDALNPDFEFEDEDSAALRMKQQREAKPALGLEDFLKPDAASHKPQFAVPGKLGEDTLVEGVGDAQSVRSERRMADTSGFRKTEERAEGINMTAPVKRGLTLDQTSHALRDYLRGNLLGGPAAFNLDGAPTLALDPKEKVFHAPGSLKALEPYCTAELPSSAWRRLTSGELAQLRSTQPARPYADLVWLDVLMNSGGRLASHLDPGGRYRLKSRPRLDAGFPSHARIANALAQPAKLNEIAAASGAPMGEVFALVSAYDAIGLIEVERRLPRHETPSPSGLFARLRKPFGKG